MRVRFCYCFVPFKMKGTSIWGKVWKQEQFLVKARVKAAAKFMDLGKTKDFSIFCSASGNTFLTNAFNWSGLVFPCLKLYRNHCKYLEISLLQNSWVWSCCGHLMSQVEWHCFTHLYEPALLSWLLLGLFWTNLWPFWILSLWLNITALQPLSRAFLDNLLCLEGRILFEARF